MSLNGFPKRMSALLIKKFNPDDLTSIYETDPVNANDETLQPPKIWVKLPFIGKRGTILVQQSQKKLCHLLKNPCQLLTGTLPLLTSFYRAKIKHQKNTKIQSSIDFLAPVACSHFIGKTDKCLYTTVMEHVSYPNSEVYNHINSCEHFQHLKSLMELSPDEQNSDETLETNLCDSAFNNFVIIDKAGHWSVLLYKEALAIRRQKPLLNHGTKATRELVIIY